MRGKEGLRVLVCGGRDYADYHHLTKVLDEFDTTRATIAVVISGMAKGADTLAYNWGILRGKEVEEYPAEWKLYGNAAGPIRNRQMLVEGKPDVVIAFKGGNGTKNMIRIAQKAGVEVIKIG